jgi:hypothetical protein
MAMRKKRVTAAIAFWALESGTSEKIYCLMIMWSEMQYFMKPIWIERMKPVKSMYFFSSLSPFLAKFLDFGMQ